MAGCGQEQRAHKHYVVLTNYYKHYLINVSRATSGVLPGSGEIGFCVFHELLQTAVMSPTMKSLFTVTYVQDIEYIDI